MASKVQIPAVATTPWAACFLAQSVKSPPTMRKGYACETYAAGVVQMEEGAKMISSLGGPQAARNPLRAADRGYIQ